MSAQRILFAVLLSTAVACEKEAEQQPAPSSEKGSGEKTVYADPGTPVANDSAEASELIYWYDARGKKLHVFDQPALEGLIEEGIAKEIEWAPGQVVAQVMPGPGLSPVQAQVIPFPIEDTQPDAIYASVGDMRRLKYKRLVHVMRANKSGCLTNMNFAPIFRPAGTVAYVVSNRYHEYLQNAGPTVAPEFVVNTVRYTYYPVNDSMSCQSFATTEDRRPKWVIAAQNWP